MKNGNEDTNKKQLCKMAMDAEFAFLDMQNICGILTELLAGMNSQDKNEVSRYAGYIGTLSGFGAQLAEIQCERMSALCLQLQKEQTIE